jgi:6-phosphogluconolactonase/glucosamine-6-phosphate isomerase/deaminase
MQAKHPIVVATGRNSAEAVKAMLQGNITDSPMAVLRLHPGATFLLDEEAAELL